jgi:small subunit ribosomal protein S1
MLNKYLPEGSLICTSENKEYTSSLQGLEKAMREGKIIEAPAAMCDSDMNLYIDLGEVRGIMPKSEVALCKDGEEIKSIAIITRVGKPVCFKVSAITQEGGMTVAYLSRRAAQIECKREFLNDIVCGDVLKAKVTHMENFGAFVDVGCGIASLLTIDCISVSRISHPRDRLFAGMELPVLIKSIDRESGRIYVTLRELLGTWEENASGFEVGQTVTGIIRSVESYGVFVELAPNLAGLAEVKTDGSIDDPEQLIGKCTAVYIKSIIPEKMKIKLIIIDSQDSPPFSEPLKYFIDTKSVTHIDSWTYSPSSSKRVIETVF